MTFSTRNIRQQFVVAVGGMLIGCFFSTPAHAAGPQAGIALAQEKLTYAVWEEGDASHRAVYLSRKDGGGKAIGAPVKVNDRPKGVGTALGRGPRLAVNWGGAVAVLWDAATDGGSASTPFRVSYSGDGGKTFRPSISLPTRKGLGPQDLGDLALGPDGTIHAVWLQNDPRGGMGFWYARSAAGKPFSPAVILDRVACECCQTSVAAGQGDNTVAVAWRDNVNNVRDVKARISTDGGKSFGPATPVRNDGWKIDGCPMQGPSVTVSQKGEVAVAWSEAASGTPRVHVARWDGEKFLPLEGLPQETPATHPVARYDLYCRLWVAWEEKLGPIWADPPADARIRVATARRDGKFGPAQTASSGRVRFPALAVMDYRATVGWWEGGGQRGETSVVRTGGVNMIGPATKDCTSLIQNWIPLCR